MNQSFKPTSEQQAIISHATSRHARVLAGPGTGKSATLVAMLDGLQSSEQAPRTRLLTFTRAATAELAEKIAKHPGTSEERPSTIHSFAISVLLQNPGAGDFPRPLRIADDWERDEIVYPTLARRANVRKDRISRLVTEMAANWEALSPQQDPKVDPLDRTRFLGAWNEHRDIYGYTLLAELPYALLQAMHDHPDLKGIAYGLVVVDEYQDLNACDLAVLKQLGDNGASIIAAGDDDQSIYSFRKAAPEGIRRFLSDYTSASDYTLTITQRCGSNIIEWANHVIQGDPDRPKVRSVLTSAAGSPAGEVALLAFPGQASEPKGIGELVSHLIGDEHVPASEILILLRGDYRGRFGDPIKADLAARGIPCSDPDMVKHLLAETVNRRALATYHLVDNYSDSLAWATLLHLTDRVGERFVDYIYGRAKGSGAQFGETLLAAFEADFPGAPAASARLAHTMIDNVVGWLVEHELPTTRPDDGWGAWMIEQSGDQMLPTLSNELADLLLELDELSEPTQTLGRYLGQIMPVGKDLAAAKSDGVRIMTMANAKGLTVRATIVAGAEQGVIPRTDCDLGEERRLLYVAMTRAKEYLYVTWARRRSGPTARSGRGQVQELRRHSSFLQGGPVTSQDGDAYIGSRW